MKPRSPAQQPAPATEIAQINANATHGSVLVLTGLFTMWGGVAVHQQVAPVLGLMLLAYLLALLTVVDIRHGVLPHLLTGTLFVLGVALAPTFGHSYLAALIGAGVAFAGAFLCGVITRVLTGQEALGGGDIWLTAALGAWLGAGGLPLFLLATAVLGAASLALKRFLTAGYPVFTEHEVRRFAFGPALCGAGWLAMLYGPVYWQFMEMLIKSTS